MSETSQLIAIYKSRKNFLQILQSRGFDTTDYEGFSINEIHALVQSKQLDLLVTSPTKKCYIKYNITKALRPNNIYEIIEDLFNMEEILTKEDDLVIIIKDEPNDSLNKLVQHIWETDKIFLIIININRLQFNILEHSLVPKHTVLSNEEAEEIKTRYNITNVSQIPTMSRFSPVSQVIGLRPSQLCKIERPSKTAITSDFFRICSQ